MSSKDGLSEGRWERHHRIRCSHSGDAKQRSAWRGALSAAPNLPVHPLCAGGPQDTEKRATPSSSPKGDRSPALLPLPSGAHLERPSA